MVEFFLNNSNFNQKSHACLLFLVSIGLRAKPALGFIRVDPVRQEKLCCFRDLKGGHHVNFPFDMESVERAREQSLVRSLE